MQQISEIQSKSLADAYREYVNGGKSEPLIEWFENFIRYYLGKSGKAMSLGFSQTELRNMFCLSILTATQKFSKIHDIDTSTIGDSRNIPYYVYYVTSYLLRRRSEEVKKQCFMGMTSLHSLQYGSAEPTSDGETDIDIVQYSEREQKGWNHICACEILTKILDQCGIDIDTVLQHYCETQVVPWRYKSAIKRKARSSSKLRHAIDEIQNIELNTHKEGYQPNHVSTTND